MTTVINCTPFFAKSKALASKCIHFFNHFVWCSWLENKMKKTQKKRHNTLPINSESSKTIGFFAVLHHCKVNVTQHILKPEKIAIRLAFCDINFF